MVVQKIISAVLADVQGCWLILALSSLFSLDVRLALAAVVFLNFSLIRLRTSGIPTLISLMVRNVPGKAWFMALKNNRMWPGLSFSVTRPGERR